MFRALVSFSGLVSMAEGEVREISDKRVVNDLLDAGYVEEIIPDKAEQPEEVKPEEEKPKKKSSSRKKTTKKRKEEQK